MLIILFVAALAVVLLVLLFWPRSERTPAPPRPPIVIHDWCEVCSAPCTHELADLEVLPDGGSGMVAMYCAAHAPANAVRVR